MKVVYDTKSHFNDYKNDPTITVTLPTDSSSLKMDLDAGVGDVDADSAKITLKNLTVSLEAGDLDLNGIQVLDTADFEIETGDADISDGNYHNVSLKGGVGDLSLLVKYQSR